MSRKEMTYKMKDRQADLHNVLAKIQKLREQTLESRETLDEQASTLADELQDKIEAVLPGAATGNRIAEDWYLKLLRERRMLI